MPAQTASIGDQASEAAAPDYPDRIVGIEELMTHVAPMYDMNVDEYEKVQWMLDAGILELKDLANMCE